MLFYFVSIALGSVQKRRFFIYIVSVANVRKKCYLTCSLDSDGQLTLVLCASAGYTTRKDLCALGNELSETSGVLVIDLSHLLGAEHTDFFLSAVRTEGRMLIFVSVHSENNLSGLQIQDSAKQ